MNIKKAIFVSDGAASQYKNKKNFASLCKFKTKYNIEAEWHFFATSHGKGPCDAICGTLKRMATRASLAREHEHPITNTKALYDWASKRHQDNFTAISFCYMSQEEYDDSCCRMERYLSTNINYSRYTKIPLLHSNIGK